MSANIHILLVASVISLLVLVAWIGHVRSCRQGEPWMPRELRNAELVYAEQLFRSGGDVPIVAKCDRGYRTKKGVIVLVELKTRKLNRVYQSDIIELSAQRFAISLQSKQKVSCYGYVLVRRPGKKNGTFHKVNLLTSEEVVVLAKRRLDIIRGTQSPAFSCTHGICKKCAYKYECLDEN